MKIQHRASETLMSVNSVVLIYTYTGKHWRKFARVLKDIFKTKSLKNQTTPLLDAAGKLDANGDFVAKNSLDMLIADGSLERRAYDDEVDIVGIGTNPSQLLNFREGKTKATKGIAR